MKKTFAYLLLSALLLKLAMGGEHAYFPVDQKGVKGVSEFESKWFGQALKNMDEPSLMGAGKSTGVFRFLLLPTWGNPISVRVVVGDRDGQLVGKRLDGLGGYAPGKLAETTSRSLSGEEVKEFADLYSKLKFFGLDTADKDAGHDGSEWIVEASDHGAYHIVVRWSPDRYDPVKRHTTDFVNLCKWLFKKAGFREDAQNKGHTEIER